MPDNSVDPSGNTEAFRAFTEKAAQEPPTAASRMPLIAGAVIVAIVVIAVIIWAVA